MKQETNLRSYVGTVAEGEDLTKMKVRRAKDSELDKAVFTQFIQEQSAGTPLSGPIIRTQAEKFHQHHHTDEPSTSVSAEHQHFVVSKGWLHGIQKRHGIGVVAISGEQRFS
jgi:hypothetical protein